MKKLILSAVFALACFTAQANDNISNDDKNPKAKAKTTPKLALCTACGYTSGWVCNGVATSIGACRSRGTCAEAAAAVYAALDAAGC